MVEIARYILAIAGVEYEDYRYQIEDYGPPPRFAAVNGMQISEISILALQSCAESLQAFLEDKHDGKLSVSMGSVRQLYFDMITATTNSNCYGVILLVIAIVLVC